MKFGEIAAAGIVLAVVGACAYGATVLSIHPPPAPVVNTGPTPVAEPLAGAVVATRDGQFLVYTDADRCARQSPTLTESDTEVRLTYAAVSDAGWCDRPGWRNVPLPLGVRAQFRLQRPLAGRRVVDATTGRPVPVIAETDIPRVVTAIPGYRPGLPVATSVVSDFGGPDSATGADYYELLRETGTGKAVANLWVVTTTGSWHPPAGTVTRPIRVRGVAGRAATGIVVWTTGGRTYALRWDSAPGVPLLNTAALVAVADSLVSGGTS